MFHMLNKNKKILCLSIILIHCGGDNQNITDEHKIYREIQTLENTIQPENKCTLNLLNKINKSLIADIKIGISISECAISPKQLHKIIQTKNDQKINLNN
ncbi:MAG: hypothetical protein R3B45_06790 [Bdellovibrionota bacterium]